MKSLTFGLGLRSNDVMATRRSTKKRTIGLMSKTTTSHVHHTSLYNSLPFLHYHDVKMAKAPSTHIRIILKTDFFPSVFKTYRVFSHDVTVAILVSQNNEAAAMLVSQTSPLGVELFSYANAFFCYNKFA